MKQTELNEIKRITEETTGMVKVKAVIAFVKKNNIAVTEVEIKLVISLLIGKIVAGMRATQPEITDMPKLKKIENNFHSIELNGVKLYFSYETLVGFFHPIRGHVVAINTWGNTTGKHLTLIDGGDKQSRVSENSLNEIYNGRKPLFNDQKG